MTSQHLTATAPVIFDFALFTVRRDAAGGLILTRSSDGADAYFQPGDDAAEAEVIFERMEEAASTSHPAHYAELHEMVDVAADVRRWAEESRRAVEADKLRGRAFDARRRRALATFWRRVEADKLRGRAFDARMRGDDAEADRLLAESEAARRAAS